MRYGKDWCVRDIIDAWVEGSTVIHTDEDGTDWEVVQIFSDLGLWLRHKTGSGKTECGLDSIDEANLSVI